MRKKLGDRSSAIDRVLRYLDAGTFESELRARVCFRTESQKAGSLGQLHEYLDAHGFSEVEIITPEGTAGFTASRTDPDHPWVIRVADSIENTIQMKPAIIPSMGGSICNDLFTDLLGLPAIWIPHSYAACSQHAPDEHILMSVVRSALPLMTGLYWDIGNHDVVEDETCKNTRPK